MLISLRGTNGSGKSTVIRSLFKMSKTKVPKYSVLGPRLPEAYQLDLPKVKEPVFVLGPYMTGAGGCDCIQPYELIGQLIQKYARRGHVVFEGVLMSSTYGQIGELMEQWKKDSVFVFLDTTLEQCLSRVESRRGDKARDARLVKNVSGKYESSLRVKERLLTEDIMTVKDASSANGHELVLKLLQGA